MQKLEVHPPSLLAGSVLAVLAFIAMAPTPPPPSTAPTPPGLIPARNMIQIHQGTPYTVPTGQLLVVTGLGSFAGISGGFGAGIPATLSVNGVGEIGTRSAEQGPNQMVYGDNLPEVRSMVPVPPGFAIAQGSVVTVTGVAWGYIERY